MLSLDEDPTNVLDIIPQLLYKYDRKSFNIVTLALAQKYSCSALFARKVAELQKEIDRDPFPVEILFLKND